ncbi:MAG: family 78 glycoside hydrolase catalytic domain, partial [Clostridia bacterium]|nr:family 78 glycoside hydrolase catalytic domain [Clostridia bacterium]
VLDMGQNMTGRLAFKKPAAGQKVHLQFGEVLQEDCFYRDNLRSAKAEFTYVSDGGEGWVSSRFTFYGFRYVKLEGFENVTPENFEGEVLCSEMERTAEIRTGNALADRFAENVFWGQRGNFLDVPTDCPQRDERMGWTGDAQAFCGTAMYQTDSAAFYAKYMRDMLTEQLSRDGGVPHVVPAFHLVCQPVCAWSDAACIIPWTLYTFYGDKAMLAQQYESMRLWADWIYRLDEKTGGSRLWQAGFHYADWLALDAAHPASCTGGTDRDFIASCYYYYSTLLTAKAAAVLQKEEDSALFAARAEEIRAAIRREYFTASGKPAINTQTACVLLLQLGLAEESEKPLLRARLDRLLEDARGELRTGFVGTIWLCRVLAHEGMAGRAVDLFLREDYPGWLYEVKMGATTVWERWNSMLPDGRVSDTGMNSFNHYAYGSVMEWFCRDAAGLAPSEEQPGFRKAIMAPRFDPRLSGTSLRYESPCGEYQSAWTIDENNTVHWTVAVPFGAEAEVLLPAGELKGIDAQQIADGWQALLPAGKYDIELHCEVLPWGPSVLDVPLTTLLKDEKIGVLLRSAAPTLEKALIGNEKVALRRLRSMSLSALPPQELRAVEQVLNACAFEGSK